MDQDLRRLKIEVQQSKRVAYARLTGVLFTTLNHAFVEKATVVGLREQLRGSIGEELRQRVTETVRDKLAATFPTEQLDEFLAGFEARQLIDSEFAKFAAAQHKDAGAEIKKRLGYSSAAPDLLATEQWHSYAAEVIFISEDRLREPVTDAIAAVMSYLANDENEATHKAARDAINSMQNAMLDDLRSTIE